MALCDTMEPGHLHERRPADQYRANYPSRKRFGHEPQKGTEGKRSIGPAGQVPSMFLTPSPHQSAMIVSITGTPGTGKSTVGALLQKKGNQVIELTDFIKAHSLYDSFDEARESYDVDPEVLDKALKEVRTPGTTFLIGHLSHLVTTDMIIVLRCRPSVLVARLKERGWKETKIDENAEAEACDVILIESTESMDNVFEIDTTTRSSEGVVEAIEEILAGEREKYAVGQVDWSSEVLDWF
jgi:adenylate kinase